MGNQINYKNVLERIQEAEQLLKIGIEKGSLSAIERDILLEKLRGSYEMLLFEKKPEQINPTLQQIVSHKVEKIKVEPTREILAPSREPEIKPAAQPKKSSPPQSIETKTQKKEEVHSEILTKEIRNASHKGKLLDVDERSDNRLIDIEPEVAIEQNTEDQAAETSTEIEENKESIGYADKSQAPILGEKYQGKKKFRNETLGIGKQDMASKLQNKPILDLTKAIGINDKFLFTKELFNGNAELYARTIRKLNDFTDINDALFFIQDNFNWDSKNEAANQLMELVRRKLLFS
jgi:hypothetical protein